MSKLSNVWVFSDTSKHLPEVVAGGFEIGEKVSVFVIGSEDEVVNAYALGATEVYCLGAYDFSKIIESYAKSMAKVIVTGEGKSLVLMPGTKRCKALASLLGVELNAGVVTDVSHINVDEHGVMCKHMAYGGLAMSEELIKTAVSIVVISGGVFEGIIADTSKRGEAKFVDFVETPNNIKCIDRRSKEGSSVDLNKAKRIVAIGRGIAKKEDIKIIEELCSTLSAELGCSRPIAESEKWMEHERYIGISSVMVKPEIYFAIGISGQIQHMVGAKDSQVIVAVNKDKNAPIFDYADYGIVGNLYTIIPALVNALKQ